MTEDAGYADWFHGVAFLLGIWARNARLMNGGVLVADQGVPLAE